MADQKLLLAFPPDKSISDKDYDEGIKNYIKQLEKVAPKKWTEGAGTATDLLEVLDPSRQTLPYLYALLAHIAPYESPKAANTQPPPQLCPGGATWDKICVFTSTLDSVQIRYVPSLFMRLMRYVYRVASGTQVPRAAIQPFRDAILRLDPEGGVLTTNHLLVLRTCLSCGAYAEALPLLEKIIHAFPSRRASKVDAAYLCSRHAVATAYITEDSGFTGEVTAHDVQEYFLLGGMCYIALRMWEDAQVFLEHVLAIPSGGTATGHMVEAYRKWVLVGCLAHGYAPKLPKLVSPNASKDLKNTSKAWEALAEIFQQGDPSRLAAEIDVGKQWWAENADEGLVHELLSQLQRYFVVKLERTYSAVPVATVAQWLRQSEPDAEHYLRNLIAAGQLNATIESSAGAGAGGASILRFGAEKSKAGGEEQQLRDLQAQAARTSLLAEYVRDADRKLTVTKEYVVDLLKKEALKKQQVAGNGAEGGGAGVSGRHTMPGGFTEEMDVSFDGQDGDDEDLMGDV